MRCDAGGRLLLIGLHAIGSALTGVGMSLAHALAAHCEVGYAGIELADVRHRYACLPSLRFATTMHSRGPHFGVKQTELDAVVAQFNPGWVMVIGPPFMTRPLLEQLQRYRPALCIATYAAIETELTEPLVLDVLRGCDRVLTYSEFARDSIARLIARSGGAPLPSPIAVGHGIASQAKFHPVRGDGSPAVVRAMRQQALAASQGIGETSFLVLNANRAYLRKRLDLSVAGFAEFIQRSDADAHLYFHSLFIPERERQAITEQAAAAGLGERVHIIPKHCSERPRSLADLNLLFNTADVGLNTAMGEGFGLASFEHGLTARPQIVPDHTGLHENWRGAAELVPATLRQPIFYEYGDMFAVSACGVADSLMRLYSDREYRDQAGAAAFARAHATAFTWAAVAQRMLAAIATPAGPAPPLGR